MEVNLTMLILDWFEEHYPGMCYAEPPLWDYHGMMLCLRDTPKGRSHFIGRIVDAEFIPWIFRGDDPRHFLAADPEFFNKINTWFTARVTANDWIALEPYTLPSLRDI